jgi:isocitrate dehydrogenase (NAD+)
MLEHVGRAALARHLRNAIGLTLNEDGVRTSDLGGKASTSDFSKALIKRIKLAST